MSFKHGCCRENETLFWITRYIFILAERNFYISLYIWKRLRTESAGSDSYNVSHVQLSDRCREGQARMWSCETANILKYG
jgi:hypothetical protein